MLKGVLNKIRSGINGESGQSAVLVVLSLTVLMGCAALAVDLGADYKYKMEMQNAADIAAVACARKLTRPDIARRTGMESAVSNGAPPEGVEINTPYDGDSFLVEVKCTEVNEHGFAKVFGSDRAVLTGRAVARLEPPSWAGSALPILNVEDFEEGEEISIWEKNSPGNFGALYKKKLTWVEGTEMTPGHYEIEYEDGVYVENGKIGVYQQEIESMCQPGRTVFLFSLSQEAIEDGGVVLSQGALVPKDKLVLLKCTVNDYNFHSIKVTVEEVYDIYGNSGEPRLPDDFTFNADECGSSLVA